MRFIVDAHEDLAWNMLTFGRDYTRAATETRRLEAGGNAVAANGDTLLGWPDYQRGGVALVFCTLFAAPLRAKQGEWDTQVYADAGQAHRLYGAQLDVYQRLADEHPGEFRLVLDKSALESHLALWEQPLAEGGTRPVGLVPLMEGADGVCSLDELEAWWARGVRLIGPAWRATRYCGGTHEPGPLSDDGRALLAAMADFGFSLDLSHMAWEAAREALDRFKGPVVATHANALRQVKSSESNRHLTDEIIDGLIARDGVIGVVPYNRFLRQGWKRSDPREDVPLELVADHVDYICQRAGDARHAGLGTDFDGGFGLQHVPPGIDTIADLHKLAPVLEGRGYGQDDVAAIFGGNWINHLRKSFPDS
jgi:membrane dipeptidase